MKTRFENLKRKVESLNIQELQDEVLELTSEIIKTDSRLLSVDKSWKSYGTWVTVGFANEHHFGNELSAILKKALDGHITHSEDAEYKISDFEEAIFSEIFENI